jgi:hypothetical protein
MAFQISFTVVLKLNFPSTLNPCKRSFIFLDEAINRKKEVAFDANNTGSDYLQGLSNEVWF